MLRYNTVSNKVRVIRTPGGEHRYLHIKKRGTSPKCGDCGIKLPGVGLPQVQEPLTQGRRMGN
jgi:large subunit ribosomal protein L34e